MSVLRKHRYLAAAAAVIMAFSGLSACPPPLSSFTVISEAASKLKAPDNITADVNKDIVRLNWKKVSGADAYRVFLYDKASRKYKAYRTVSKNTVKIKKLSDGEYKFRIAALVKKNGKYSVQTRSKPVTVTVRTKEENMTDRITVNTQSSIRIDCEDLIIRVDPYKIAGEPHDADIILITHAHYDHFSPDDIAKAAKSDTVFAAPKSMKSDLAKAGIKDAVLLSPGESTEIRGIKVETVRSYNIFKSFHPKSNNWLGYIITALGKRIYAAGDTDATPEAEKVKCDIALIPIGGTYTMDAKQAAELVNKIKPSVAIPIHYGSIVGNKSDGKNFASLVDKSIKTDIKL